MQVSPSVVVVTGELDLCTVASWEEEVEARGRASPAVVLDLSRVGFVDSAGVGMLFRLVRHARENDTRLLVVAPRDGPVRRVLDILELQQLTPVYESRAEAMEKCGG